MGSQPTIKSFRVCRAARLHRSGDFTLNIKAALDNSRSTEDPYLRCSACDFKVSSGGDNEPVKLDVDEEWTCGKARDYKKTKCSNCGTEPNFMLHHDEGAPKVSLRKPALGADCEIYDRDFFFDDHMGAFRLTRASYLRAKQLVAESGSNECRVCNPPPKGEEQEIDVTHSVHLPTLTLLKLDESMKIVQSFDFLCVGDG